MKHLLKPGLFKVLKSKLFKRHFLIRNREWVEADYICLLAKKYRMSDTFMGKYMANKGFYCVFDDRYPEGFIVFKNDSRAAIVVTRHPHFYRKLKKDGWHCEHAS